MRFSLLFCISFLFLTSFSEKPFDEAVYKLSLEAKGCHYQIAVNGKLVEEGKSYQRINKTIDLTKELTDSVEQKVDVTMLRISRDLPLKSTQGYVNVKLEKVYEDSTVLIKELKLPTFPYDNDEIQPQSIGGSIGFELGGKPKEQTTKPDEKLVNKLEN